MQTRIPGQALRDRYLVLKVFYISTPRRTDSSAECPFNGRMPVEFRGGFKLFSPSPWRKEMIIVSISVHKVGLHCTFS